MKQFNASHLEIKKWFEGELTTHPYETGWADEAIFFVMVEKEDGAPVMTAQVEISHDGVHWASDGSTPVELSGQGLHPIKVQPNFGNWLRLSCNITGGRMFLNIQIHCKG